MLVSRAKIMINRDNWGHSYYAVRGEILGFAYDELLRKHLPRMFSLIKNESKGRSEEHTSELHHTVISYAVFCLKKKKENKKEKKK